MPYVYFEAVSYETSGRRILDDLNLSVERGETLVLLGRSGSGKTTALRLVNRMLEPTHGAIRIDGTNIRNVDPIALRRRIGYVIQEFGLMPHWSVEQNVGLVPTLLGWPHKKIENKVEELLHQVGLGVREFAGRLPRELSGGQRQRVAVARALAAEPALLLFDEPFGALDPITRHDMQQQFLFLRNHYNLASIFVTHDLLEARALGTKIAVLDRGKVEALVTPENLLQANTTVASAFIRTLPREISGRADD